MRVLISIDEHYVSDAEHVYSTEGTTPYQFFWREYLHVFEQVIVLARVRADKPFVGRKENIADGHNVEFFPLPDFRRPLQYLRVRRELEDRIREAASQADAWILRGPGLIGGFLARELERTGRPYAVQVTSDPWEVFGRGRSGGAPRLFYRPFFTRQVKRLCKQAVAVSYVTRAALQRRYPAAPGVFSAAWSDVQIADGIASEREVESRLESIARISNRQKVVGFLGSLEQPYKGADVLVRAVALCRQRGLDVATRLAGSGKLLPEYKRLADKLSLGGHVEFLGRIGAGGPVFRFLDDIDLFVMPSLTEGLPRAMIEAMARACPCLGSNVGGIPELLDSTQLVGPGDAAELARKIIEKLESPDELARMARRNHQVAKQYTPEHAKAARTPFLEAIRDIAIRSKQKATAGVPRN
jgi:glycosyltransferase involved in cell wall biosynthesis